MMAGCYKEDIPEQNSLYGNSNHSGSGSGNTNGATGSGGTNGSTGGSNTGSGGTNGSGNSNSSHYCGYPTKAGTPCKRLGSGASGYCWQHK